MRNDDDGGAAGGDPASSASSASSVIRVIRLAGGKANAMDDALLSELERQIDELERGPARAAVLTGYERFFSAGLPLPRLVDLDRAGMRAFIERFARAMRRVLACEKPLVAAINGHAIAGGCVLALMCDWRICADGSAKIGLNETQLGVGLPAIVIEPLRAQVPPASLVPIALEGRLFSPREAHALGLVHEVVAPDALLARAEAKARDLAVPAPIAVAQVKRALRAPILEAVARTAAEETERWLDSWFTDAAQARLRAAVAGLGGGAA
ncbi:MAG TPA: enoyl-CoA hydratase/isomerase family protein [Kofleriaceae bacterium]|nr:enoyl-CoA hydratase/isomerase family protein [Kofleriaceae bacterium]